MTQTREADSNRTADGRRRRDELASADAREAWRQICLAMAADSSSTTCATVAATMATIDAQSAGLPELCVALLTNFTIEPLVPILVAHGATSGLAIRPFVAPFDTWAQEIADPKSAFRRHRPDVVVLNLRLDMLCPRLVDEFLSMSAPEVDSTVAETAERLTNALRTLRGWSPVFIALHSFLRPLHPTLGILDNQLPSGQTATIAALNDRISTTVREIGNACVIDTDRLCARLGESVWQDHRMWAHARLPYGAPAMHAIADEYLRIFRAVAGRTRKVLVLDVDDTLWGGVVGEAGPEGIALGDYYPGSAYLDVQRAVLEWHRRGVILCLNSKNDEREVLEVLDQHPSMLVRSQDFAAIRINWQDKAANMTELASELGLGLDSFVFVDDNIVECDRMRQALPEVHTVHLHGEPGTRAAVLRALGVFDSLSYGTSDRSRGEQYRTEAVRRKLQSELPSLEDFYRSLQMVLTIEPVSDETLPRAADLTQRTNQFNLCPRRFTEAELARELARNTCEGFVFRLRDRFGDYGIVGFAMFERRRSRVAIVQFLLSCRVLKRTVEDSALAFLVQRARAMRARELTAWCTPTRRNGPAREFVESRGFEPSVPPASDVTVFYQLPPQKAVEYSPWVKLVSSVPEIRQ